MIIAIDTETYKYDKAKGIYEPVLDAREFVVGCAMTDTGITKIFYDHIEMHDWLISKIEANISRKKKTYIYAHNMEFDYYAIFQDHLLDENMKYIVFNPFIAIYMNKGYFLDTMSFYKTSLENVGDMLGYKKLEMPKYVHNPEQLLDYVKRDTEIVLRSIIELKDMINKIGFRPRKILTAGQLAITSFMTYARKEKLGRDLFEFNWKKKILQITKTKYPKIIREAFRGGNNQAFKTGEFKNCTLLDINGLYAYAMKNMNFPNVKTEQKINNPEIGMLKGYMKENVGIARCSINVPTIKLPYLPVRYHKYQVFPSSKVLRGTWTFIELSTALGLGYEILDCEWCIRYEKSLINPLARFVDYLYEQEKVADNEAMKGAIKLIRNNLYGKFAQYKQSKDYKFVERYKVQDFIEKGYSTTSSVGNKYICVKQKDDYNPSYINPMISIQITAFARDYLYKELSKVPYKDLLYCDTDSILFKGNHISKFKVGKELGEWKIEAIGDAKILGEKRYYVDEKVKISGLMKRQITKDIIQNESDVNTLKMVGLKEALSNGNIEDVGGFRLHTIEMKPHNKMMLPLPDTIDEIKNWVEIENYNVVRY